MSGDTKSGGRRDEHEGGGGPRGIVEWEMPTNSTAPLGWGVR